MNKLPAINKTLPNKKCKAILIVSVCFLLIFSCAREIKISNDKAHYEKIKHQEDLVIPFGQFLSAHKKAVEIERSFLHALVGNPFKTGSIKTFAGFGLIYLHFAPQQQITNITSFEYDKQTGECMIDYKHNTRIFLRYVDGAWTQNGNAMIFGF